MIAMTLDWQDTDNVTVPSKAYNADDWQTFISEQSCLFSLVRHQTLAIMSRIVMNTSEGRNGSVVTCLTAV